MAVPSQITKFRRQKFQENFLGQLSWNQNSIIYIWDDFYGIKIPRFIFRTTFTERKFHGLCGRGLFGVFFCRFSRETGFFESKAAVRRKTSVFKRIELIACVEENI